MRDVTVNGKVVRLYESIDEMPIVNYQKYNKYVLLDSNLGSDIESVDEHIIRIAKYISKDDKANAMQELQNMRQNMHMVVNDISPNSMAFAALIYSIDGKEQKDLSDTHLREIMEELRDMPYGVFAEMLAWVKKKLSTELELYFPSEFDSAKEKEAYTKLKMRTVLQLQELMTDEDNSEQIAKIDDLLFGLRAPRKFVGKDSEEIRYDKQFESACMVISQKTGMNAKTMMVLEFYNTLLNIQKQTEAERKAYKKR